MYATAALALDEGLDVVFAPAVAMDDGNRFFGSRPYREAFVEFWKKVATHFIDEKRTIAYDLMNEPHDRRARTQWSGYAKELTRTIRAIDTAHTLMVEPPEWGWPAGFKYLKPTGDENTVYSFHTYAPNEFTTQKTPKGFLTATEDQWAARIYPGGTMEGVGWAYYSYREWQVMDLEMSDLIKNAPTARAETEFVNLLRESYR